MTCRQRIQVGYGGDSFVSVLDEKDEKKENPDEKKENPDETKLPASFIVEDLKYSPCLCPEFKSTDVPRRTSNSLLLNNLLECPVCKTRYRFATPKFHRFMLSGMVLGPIAFSVLNGVLAYKFCVYMGLKGGLLFAPTVALTFWLGSGLTGVALSTIDYARNLWRRRNVWESSKNYVKCAGMSLAVGPGFALLMGMMPSLTWLTYNRPLPYGSINWHNWNENILRNEALLQ